MKIYFYICLLIALARWPSYPATTDEDIRTVIFIFPYVLVTYYWMTVVKRYDHL